MNKPIKRHLTLQPLSREHHQGLLLCFKIRKGISSGVEISRIKDYVNWFYTNHLMPHFELEENHIFPILGKDHELIKQAISEHRNLQSLVADSIANYEGLETFAAALDNHIRFEERILFNEIEKSATTEQFKKIEEIHHEEVFCEKSDDEFWV